MKLIKYFFLRCIFYFGIYSIFHYIHRKKITILYAHSISQITAKNKWKPLRSFHDSADLDFTLNVLKKKYQFISLSTALKVLNKEIAPIDNALVLTLDDGYFNNIATGGPIFKKYGIEPTIFISTEHTEHNIPFWFDRLDYALQQIKVPELKTEVLNNVFIFDCSSRQALKSSYASFRKLIKKSFKDDLEMRDYLERLTTTIELQTGKKLQDIIHQDNFARLASWEELKKSQKEFNFEVGSHAVHHSRLALLDDKIISEELSKSKEIIESKLCHVCDTFCYPDNSYNNKVKFLVKKSYKYALTTIPGLNHKNNCKMTLKRMNLPTDNNSPKILFKISALKLTLLNKISG